MTTRSEHTAVIRYTTGDFGSYDPADVDLARTVRNNLHHALDCFGEVVVAWSTASFDAAGSSVVGSGLISNVTDHLWTSPPFYVRIQPDGSAFPVRVAAFVQDSTGGVGTTSVRIALTTTNNPGIWYRDAVGGEPDVTLAPDASVTNVYHQGSIGVTAVWTTPAVLTLPADRVRGQAVGVQVRTVDAIGGNTTTVEAVRCRLTIWRGAKGCRLYAAYAAEYCGGT